MSPSQLIPCPYGGKCGSQYHEPGSARLSVCKTRARREHGTGGGAQSIPLNDGGRVSAAFFRKMNDMLMEGGTASDLSRQGEAAARRIREYERSGGSREDAEYAEGHALKDDMETVKRAKSLEQGGTPLSREVIARWMQDNGGKTPPSSVIRAANDLKAWQARQVLRGDDVNLESIKMGSQMKWRHRMLLAMSRRLSR